MDPTQPRATSVFVRNGRIEKLGNSDDLQSSYPDATLDVSLQTKVLTPGFIDPHVHMIMGAIIYALPFVPPWDMETPKGLVKGLANKEALIARLQEIEKSMDGDTPLIAYGYHNLVHGDLTRHDLDLVSKSRPVLIWHYSGHDFYLNSAALDWAGVDKSWQAQYEGVALGDDGEPNGRLYEDAPRALFGKMAIHLLTPGNIEQGFSGFESMLAKAGVTTVAELGYGLFGKRMEDAYYFLEYTKSDPYHLYLVPEHRAFSNAFGDDAVAKVQSMAADTFERGTPKVLPQVKFFTDAAFYSQTMRLTEPGYLEGQSAGTVGLWATPPGALLEQIRPYWEAGLDIHIHSNGDAAQQVTLETMRALRKETPSVSQRFVVEHAGLLKPEHIQSIADLGGGVSAASHYVHYMGEQYRSVIGERVKFMTPLASSMRANIPTTLHSDAPLAPPYPLQAASVHMTRSTRQGTPSTPTEALTRYKALKAITIDAAWSLGLENDIGSISVGKRANFSVLDANPLNTEPERWPDIAVWGVVLDGVSQPLR